MKVIFETERLLIREYVEEDAEVFFKLNSNPEVLRFVPDKALLNVEQARQLLIDHPIADYRKHGFGRAGEPADGLHWSHGDVTERAGDRESISRVAIEIQRGGKTPGVHSEEKGDGAGSHE
jgi:hypothetical protein